MEKKSQYFQKTGDPVFPCIYFHLTKPLPILLYNHSISKVSFCYDLPDVHFINLKIFEKNPVLYSPPLPLSPHSIFSFVWHTFAELLGKTDK